ncbi:hypothetical protein [Variovorax paradoxus]|uniref:galactose-binding domain-containing protein n=1 Tax=Variovorax paradoxus TaxID=34073 RepID=UPI001F194CB6
MQYDLGHAERVQRYSVTSTPDVNLVERDPKDWQLQGSNDGSNWTTLDTQSSQTRFERKTCAVASPGSYWLNITADNGDSAFTAVSEMGLFVSRP